MHELLVGDSSTGFMADLFTFIDSSATFILLMRFEPTLRQILKRQKTLKKITKKKKKLGIIFKKKKLNFSVAELR